MELKLQRIKTTSDSTVGLLTLPNGNVYHTLEDTKHEVKVFGETRIPAGRYRITVANWGKALRYNEAYKDINHRGMLLLNDVPNFQGILIHTGNTKEDTLGCILVGKTVANDFIGQTREAYREIYPFVMAALESKPAQEVWITLKD